MYDRFNRRINYLRISVTDRCNLRCAYCMPGSGIRLIGHERILRYEEIVSFVRFAVGRGINKVRLTGGEPLVRKDISTLVRMLASIEGIRDLSMTTNGTLLGKYAAELAEAGLQRVNISLDTMDPETYRKITRLGEIKDVMTGIRVAQKVGLKPVKINCVVRNDSSEPDAIQVREFCNRNQLTVRFIPQMDLKEGAFSEVEGGQGGRCRICNRLRLTADGFLMPCLFSEKGYNIRTMGFEEALDRVLWNKPDKGTLNQLSSFYNIGG